MPEQIVELLERINALEAENAALKAIKQAAIKCYVNPVDMGNHIDVNMPEWEQLEKLLWEQP